MDVFMDGYMDGKIDGWMDKQEDKLIRFMDGQIDIYLPYTDNSVGNQNEQNNKRFNKSGDGVIILKES